MKWTIGDVTVTKIVELEMTGGSRFLLPQATPEAILPITWLQPHFADENGRLRMSIHSFIVETPDHRIVVDTCLGNDKQGRRIPHWNDRDGPFLADLAAAGFPAESIDTVLCTHLHVDHVGWNTRLVDGKWVPTFPRARYLMGRAEQLAQRGVSSYLYGVGEDSTVGDLNAFFLLTEQPEAYNLPARPVPDGPNRIRPLAHRAGPPGHGQHSGRFGHPDRLSRPRDHGRNERKDLQRNIPGPDPRPHPRPCQRYDPVTR